MSFYNKNSAMVFRIYVAALFHSLIFHESLLAFAESLRPLRPPFLPLCSLHLVLAVLVAMPASGGRRAAGRLHRLSRHRRVSSSPGTPFFQMRFAFRSFARSAGGGGYVYVVVVAPERALR
jgi:hypothetical protein